MRKRFEQQPELDTIPISEVSIDLKSRHQLAPLLASLQYLFTTPSLSEQIFEALEASIGKDLKKTGRMGMSLWEILVLGNVRLNLEKDFDELLDLANNHQTLRGILGIATHKVFANPKTYALQTLKDNVRLLDEATLQELNTIVVKAGHQMLKKKEDPTIELELKADTYVVESTIHFPTDLSLLWDCARKCLTLIGLLYGYYPLQNWRNFKNWLKKTKRHFVKTAYIHQKKGANYKSRLAGATKKYLKICKKIQHRIDSSTPVFIAQIEQEKNKKKQEKLRGKITELKNYKTLLDKHIDLVERRILKEETIPHEEKIFSIFEQHVEWKQKGKQHKKVELGHNALICSDQYHFILDYQVIDHQADVALVQPLADRLQERFIEQYLLSSISFDRGFYSQANKEYLVKIFVQAILPKRGKKTAAQREEESAAPYQKLRHAHSAVESNINELEHSGPNKVPDKGFDSFKRYVGLGILAYNLKRLGHLLLAKQRKAQKAAAKVVLAKKAA